MWKHRIKAWTREAYARLLYHTGLHRVINRVAPRRLTILAGHCVTAETNAFLPPDMKVAPDKLRRMLDFFQRHYDVCTVEEGVARLESGNRGGRRGLLALSMDDGYRDNVDVMLPLLQEMGATATVYLETGAVSQAGLNWSHKYFWLLERWGIDVLLERYLEVNTEEATAKSLAAAAGGDRVAYRAKRVLKYEAGRAERDRVVDVLFREEGGDEAGLCQQLYMDWDGARRLRDGGVELGGHTVNHPVLARLDEDEQRAELSTSDSAIRDALGATPRTLAYPFGRAWDFDGCSAQLAGERGYLAAVTSHAGANVRGADPMRLKRWMIDDDCQMHLLVAEACGGFELLSRLGLRLSE